MERKYIIPATTMVTALVLFFSLFIINLFVSHTQMIPTNRVVAIVVSLLTVYSGYVCRKVGGPKAGNLARFIFLIVFTALAWWQIGKVSAIIFLVMALIPLVLFFAGEVKSD